MRLTRCPRYAPFLSLLMSSALLVSMLVVAPLSSAKSPHKTKSTTPVVNPQGNSQRQRQPAPRDDSRKVDPIQPERGAPAANLPNLEELRSRKPEKPEAPPPVPSTIRSKRKHQPNGNGVNSNSLVRPADDGAGTSISRNGLSRSENRSLRSHHARRGAPSFTPTESATAAPPFAAMPQSSSNVALNKLATQSSTYGGAGGAVPGLAVDGNTSGNWWPDYSVSSTNADAGAWWQVDLGGTFAIQSVEVWNRTDCCGDRLTNFDVILRDQNLNDISTVNFPGQAGTPSTISISGAARYVKIKLAGTNYLSLAEVRVWGTPIGSASDSERALARLDPFNQPGNQLKARDCEWSLPLVSLPGRAGWDLGLTLYYSSMVWTRAANSMYFDEDNGNPSPGFRLGFPTLGNVFLDAQANVNARMMVTSSGRHVEFRYAGHNSTGFDLYKASDSSYAELLDYTSSIWLRTTDGTDMNFAYSGGEWHCVLIRDRNGNKISADYTPDGDLNWITDTLGRIIHFHYDGYQNVDYIWQTWTVAGLAVEHRWATFGWETKSFTPAFSGVSVFGSYMNIPVLNQVGLADGSYYKFTYNNSGQVNVIQRFTSDGNPGTADDIQRSTLTYDYDTPSGDCPRILAAHVTADNWLSNVQTNFGDLGGGWHSMTMPDGTNYRELYSTSGWQRGLTTRSEIWQLNGSVSEKTTSIDWDQDQDAPCPSCQKNPRITQTIVDDRYGNHRRTTIDYGGYAQWGLPYCVTEYANNGSTELRKAYTDYNLSQQYLDWHIIGLVSEVKVFDSALNRYLSRTTYGYDNSSQIDAQATTAAQHDQSFNTSQLTRGNVTSVAQWDTTNGSTINDPNGAHTTQIRYNAAGSVLSATDAAGHQNQISYGDSFSDGNNGRNTFAYPTMVKDADWNASTAPNDYSTIQYNFDFGATTQTQGPPPAGQTSGAVQTITYDNAGRVDRVALTGGAYRRLLYYPSWWATIDTINNQSDESVSFNSLDGMGRVWMKVDYPATGGEVRAQWTRYDAMGRVGQQSNPALIDASWTPTGDDAAGWIFTTQTYDWKGRPLRTIHPAEGGYSYYTELSYTGCGCAGGQVVTATDEAGRQRRTTSDVLGRMVKSEELNFDGSPYSTANYVYDALDQIKSISHEGQVRSFDYDGYGRLRTRITPEQGATTYAYNNDDTVQSVTDARGVVTSYLYNNRHLPTSINYDVSGDSSGNSAWTAPVAFGYDAAGNRTSMTDATGSATYHYDQLSRMDWEERSFGVLGPYRLIYTYNFANELTGITGPTQFGSVQVAYNYDTNGRLTSVGSGYGDVTNYASDITYRAFGAIKAMSFHDGHSLSASYDNRMRPTSWNVSNVLGYNYSYFEHTDRVNYARNLSSNGGRDGTLDRSYEYDQVGALVFARSGAEARAAFGVDGQQWGTSDGPYSHMYDYDKQGNMIRRFGWGGEVQGGARYGHDTDIPYTYSTNKNQRDGLGYDAAGNVTYDGYFNTYNASNQQTLAESGSYILAQYYDGDGLRVTKYDNGPTTNYLRSTVLGGAVVVEINANNNSTREYVYAGGELLAVQQNSAVSWVHSDPVTKSQRTTDATGNVVNTVELDPWGANTNRCSSSIFQPQNFTTYIRDGNGQQDAMARRYSVGGRFSQPDPYGGSYNFSDPQSFNRYAYTQNDPVNRRDPSGLDATSPITLIGRINRPVVNAPDPFDAGTSYDQGGGHAGDISGWFGSGSEDMGIVLGNEEPGGGGRGGSPSPPDRRCPPTIEQMLANKKIRAELNAAFAASGHRTDHPLEHGGWIYQSRNGRLLFVRAGDERGSRGSINLMNPTKVRGAIVVGEYHTHPYTENAANNSLSEGFNNMRPSQQDEDVAFRVGVPDLVVFETAFKNGVPVIMAWGVGPNRRGGAPGSAGPPEQGYPGYSVNNTGCR